MSTEEVKALKKLTDAVNRLANTFASTSRPIQFEQHNHAPEGADPVSAPVENTSVKLPAYLLGVPGETIDFDNSPANGLARISGSGIDIHIGTQYYTDLVREVIAKGEPVAVTVGITYSRAFNLPEEEYLPEQSEQELNDQIDKLHGTGAAAALDAAIADGSIFGSAGDGTDES